MPQRVHNANPNQTSHSLILSLLTNLPRHIQHQAANTKNLAEVFRSHFAHAFFTRVHKNYLVKAQGQVDNLGERWKPLAKSTIRQRQTIRGHSLHNIVLSRLAPRIGHKKASQVATSIATAAEKSLGRKPRLLSFGDKQFLIGVLSGKLLSSLSPGRVLGDRYVPSDPDQHYTGKGFNIELGSDVEYAKYFHAKRPFFPTDQQKLDTLMDQALDDTVNSLAAYLAKTIR